MEIIEKVARAICKEYNENPDTVVYEDDGIQHIWHWQQYESLAKAVIKAIKVELRKLDNDNGK